MYKTIKRKMTASDSEQLDITNKSTAGIINELKLQQAACRDTHPKMRHRTVDVSSSSTALRWSFREGERDRGRGKFKSCLNEVFSGPSLYLYYFNYTRVKFPNFWE